MKRLIIIVVVLGVLSGLGFWFGRPVYRGWKQDRLIAGAEAALVTNDLRSATLGARQVLAMNPGSVRASRVMASVTERMGQPSAVQWRERLVELEPDSVTNRLALAGSALLRGEFEVAASALQAIPKTNRDSVVFHELAAMLAIGVKKPEMAELHLGAAEKLDPDNKRIQLNRAVIRAQASDQVIAAEARRTLEKLCSEPLVRRDALRQLCALEIHDRDLAAALEHSRQLVAESEPNLDDRLMRLGILKLADDPSFETQLTALQTECAAQPGYVASLVAWMVNRDMVGRANRWIAGLPEEIRAARPVQLSQTDVFVALGEWEQLREYLEAQNWGEIDFLRLANLCRVSKELGGEFGFQTRWHAAVKAASERSQSLVALDRFVNRLGWAAEHDELLWLIVQKYPAEKWALDTLKENYTSQGNTRGLYKIYNMLLNYNPQDFAIRNNLAAVSLLLNVQPARAAELAREAWTRYPTNPACASTYAYALQMQGDAPGALKVLEKLDEKQLRIPTIAAYYGLVLAANQQTDKARIYLQVATNAQLLPEERVLVESALKEQ